MKLDGRQSHWTVPFFTIWTGQAFSLIGSALVQFALVWWLTETTGSATVLASAVAVALLPGMFLGPFVGALIDRWDRRKVMILSDGLIALMAAGLACIFWSGRMRVGYIYIVVLVRAVAGIFHWPAWQASTSLMVPQGHLPRIAGMNQTIRGAVDIVSPPLAALLLLKMPLYGVLMVDVVTAALAISSLLIVHVPKPSRTEPLAGTTAPSLWGDVRVGFRYLRDRPGLLAIGLVASVLNFLVWPSMALTPILVTNHFRGQALQLGWLNSTWGIGLVSGGLILSVWGGFRRRISTCIMGVIGLGIGFSLVGLTPSTAFGLALVGLFCGGVMHSMTQGAAFALLQEVVAPEMQGRVFTSLGSLTSAMAPLGMAIAGPVADLLGVRWWYIGSGAAQVLLGIAATFVPAIMLLEEKHSRRLVRTAPADDGHRAPVADVGPRINQPTVD
ncbi:MAG: MFS transporter [Anaerolineae bacterium]|jgi:DHA3 family macrolide efflux protein-like MFS transporter